MRIPQVWGAFRVAQRAQIIESYVDHTKSGFFVGGAHDGYKNEVPFIHKRT